MRNAALALGIIAGCFGMIVGFVGFGYTELARNFSEVEEAFGMFADPELVRIASILSPMLAIAGGAMAPSRAFLGGLFLILSARPLITAWFLLECDWARVGTAQRFAAAIITTIAIFTSVLMQEARSAALPAALLTIELIALTMIARWKGGSDAPEEEAAAHTVEEPRLLAG